MIIIVTIITRTITWPFLVADLPSPASACDYHAFCIPGARPFTVVSDPEVPSVNVDSGGHGRDVHGDGTPGR
jgi:hypothetical protein